MKFAAVRSDVDIEAWVPITSTHATYCSVGSGRWAALKKSAVSLFSCPPPRRVACTSASSRRASVVRGPDELAPVAFGELHPRLERRSGIHELTRAHEEPCLDGLAVPAAVAVTGRAAELDRLEIGAEDVEQRQR